MFNDTNLSEPAGQSCTTCHQQELAFTDTRNWFPTSLGADGESFGTRNSPTGSYAAFVPPLGTTQRFNPLTETFTEVPFGGLFIDGRASTLEEQAKVPFFADNEMALSSPRELSQRIRLSDYADDFKAHFGESIFDNDDETLNATANAIAAFERTSRFAPFSSKFDHVQAGTDTFSESEQRGQALFNGSANCVLCHKSPEGTPELFSDLQYHNVGTPRNFDLLNKLGDHEFIDRGHGAVTGDVADDGLFRTPTLRNVAITAPYMHNGVFKTLREVVVFYNTREAGLGLEPEIRNANIPPPFVLGDLGLSDQDIDDIVAFMKTLTDK